jgi:hypothetical protein
LNYPTGQCSGGYNELFFFNAIGQELLREEALESLEKRHYETLCFLKMYFPPAFFDININFTTHLIKEIKLLGHVFFHQMYAYERFNSILKSFVRNYGDLSNPIGVPKSHHEGRLTGKGTIGKKAITSYLNLFHCAYFHVLQ